MLRTAHSQLVMMTLPADILLKVHEASRTPFLVETLTFSDWSVLSGIYENHPEALDKQLQALAINVRIVASRNKIESREINKIIANGERIILGKFGYSTTHLTEVGDIDVSEQVNVRRQERRRRIGLSQAEIEYLEKQQEIRLNTVLSTASTAADAAGRAHKLGQESHFLPLASGSWIERQSKFVSHKLWHLDNFNYAAPISIEAFKALANLSGKELQKCKEAADNFALHLPANRPALDGNFPILAILDKTKCAISKQLLIQKAFPRAPQTLEEVKKMWNTGRDYLKCTCSTNCGKTITWFDHFIWYYIANLDFFDPKAPSDITRMLDFQQRLKTEWRLLVLAQVSFLYMRKMMTKILERLIDEPDSTAEQLLDHPSLKGVPFANRFVAILLPNEGERIPASATSKRRLDTPTSDMVQRSRSRQTALSFTPARNPQQNGTTPPPPPATVGLQTPHGTPGTDNPLAQKVTTPQTQRPQFAQSVPAHAFPPQAQANPAHNSSSATPAAAPALHTVQAAQSTAPRQSMIDGRPSPKGPETIEGMALQRDPVFLKALRHRLQPTPSGHKLRCLLPMLYRLHTTLTAPNGHFSPFLSSAMPIPLITL
ncbi:hypothetical protein CBR_g16008 [Chara braunii]|uniref:Uncharacterized protein n=1 Tax=Chara braunii TaxID=69332 RepID=A0A388JSV9_CHABU|nr:hypothetical protein CBR_g16008 [Chara braunii]|eukprot:GBG60888.1 hypothetical protein CBR_g16008 [Chara braunii]